MSRLVAFSAFPILMACLSANDAKPASDHAADHAAAAPNDPVRKDREKDDDDDDRPSASGKQNPLPAAPTSAPATTGAARTMSFDTEKVDAAPAGFTFGRTGKGAMGKWIVKAEKDAPSGGNVLAQVDADDTDYRFPVAIANEPSLADLRLSVKCKQIAGKVDQGCGLIFRAVDADNYYVTRATALG